MSTATAPLTVAQQKAYEEAQRRAAVQRKDDYMTNVVRPEIVSLSVIVCKKLFETSDASWEGKTRDTFVTLTVDTRFSALDPEHPLPEIEVDGKYKVCAQKNYYDHEYYVHVEHWHRHAVWNGSYSPGKPGWRGIDYWHKLQVLRELARCDKNLNDPKTKEGAFNILMRFCEEHAAAGTMTPEVQAALLVMQDARRDPASRNQSWGSLH